MDDLNYGGESSKGQLNQSDTNNFNRYAIKRKARSDSEDDANHKKVVCLTVYKYDNNSHLVNLCDEMLYEIIKHLDGFSLHNLQKVSHRFYNIVRDERLWVTFDVSAVPLIAKELKSLLKLYLRSCTKTLKLQGCIAKYPLNIWSNKTLTQPMCELMEKLCPNLEQLYIYKSFLDLGQKQFKLTVLPKNLKILSIIACEINMFHRDKRIFRGIDLHFTLMEELNLEECNWIQPHDLLTLSKLPNLKKLNLRKCIKIRDFVPYASISARFGFPKLEVLDLRETFINDSDLQCFNVTKSLREILLECPEEIRIPVELGQTINNNKDNNSTNTPQLNDNTTVTLKFINSEEFPIFIENLRKLFMKIKQYLHNVSVDQKRKISSVWANELEKFISLPKKKCFQLSETELINQIEKFNYKYDAFICVFEQLINIAISIRASESSEASKSTDALKRESEQLSEVENKITDLLTFLNADKFFAKKYCTVPHADVPHQELMDRLGLKLVDNLENLSDSDDEFGRNDNDNNKNDNNNDDDDDDNDDNDDDDDDDGDDDNVALHGHVGTCCKLRNRKHKHNCKIYIVDIYEGRQRGPRLIDVTSRRGPDPRRADSAHPWHSAYMDGKAVSDISIFSFGHSNSLGMLNAVLIHTGARKTETMLEKLVLRNYRLITHLSLQHLLRCAPNLRFLDVTGTGVTEDSVVSFRIAKPDCTVISDFDHM